ncbi:hypothetical protein AAMO2058_000016300 [Amorphochlora amoebiformis]
MHDGPSFRAPDSTPQPEVQAHSLGSELITPSTPTPKRPPLQLHESPPPQAPPPPPPTGSSVRREIFEAKKLAIMIPNRRCSVTALDHVDDSLLKTLPKGFRLDFSESMRSPALTLNEPTPYEGKAASELAMILSGTTQHLFNEPSRGLYFCKKNMAKLTVRLLKLEGEIKKSEESIESVLEDVTASQPLVRSLVVDGPEAFGRMDTTLKKLVTLLGGSKKKVFL